MFGKGRQSPCLLRMTFTVITFLACLGAGCARFGPIRSQVLDVQTGHPIPGAVVLGVWTKTVGFGFTSGELVGVSEAEVDADGRFTLERPEATLTANESVTVYKFGYLAWNNEEIFPSWKHREDTSVPTRIFLELFPTGMSHERHMGFVSRVIRSALSLRENGFKFKQAIEREERMR